MKQPLHPEKTMMLPEEVQYGDVVPPQKYVVEENLGIEYI